MFTSWCVVLELLHFYFQCPGIHILQRKLLYLLRETESDESGDDESEEEEVEIQPPTNPNNDLSTTESESS